tara:strand:+ start:2021 stop:2980 length:960 start_codon:yes stop_codon:yes gene_type:complete
MLINGYKVIDRHNRPGVNQPVALRTFFVNDGQYQDPYEISGVTVFAKTAHLSPCSVLDSENLVASSVSSLVKMHFANEHPRTDHTDYYPDNYIPICKEATCASGIYRLGVGEYAVVLDGSIALSGAWTLHNTLSATIANTASGAIDYIDVWTIREVEGSKLKSIINYVTLYDNTFFTVTQPLLLTPKSRLITKKVNFGAKVDLEISNEITIGNRDIDPSIKSIFKDSVITHASVEIVKHNDEPHLPSRVTVSSFDDTALLVDITADNTLVFNFNTNDLRSCLPALEGELGSLTGNYTIQAGFNMLHETHLTDRLYFTIE